MYLIAMGQMATIRKVKRHDAVVGLEKTGVHCAESEQRHAAAAAASCACEIGGRSRQRLHVDSPLRGIKPKNFHGTRVAKPAAHAYEYSESQAGKQQSAKAIEDGRHLSMLSICSFPP